MIETEVSLVLSSMKEIDPETITNLVPLRPFRIWRRKAGLVVHGVDDIPAISWIHEKKQEGAIESQALVDQMLGDICLCEPQVCEAIKRFGLRGTVIVRLRAEDEAACVDVKPDHLQAIGTMKCLLRFEPDNGH